MLKGLRRRALSTRSLSKMPTHVESEQEYPIDPREQVSAFSIRRATLDDYDALCEVFDEGDVFHRQALPGFFRKTEGPARAVEFIANMLSDPNAAIFVAETEEEIVGVVNAAIRETPDVPILVPRRYVWVDSLMVKGSCRRMGVGRALMDRVHQWAVEQGATEVELHVWDFNRGAIAFYEDLGYATASRRMHKRLP